MEKTHILGSIHFFPTVALFMRYSEKMW